MLNPKGYRNPRLSLRTSGDNLGEKTRRRVGRVSRRNKERCCKVNVVSTDVRTSQPQHDAYCPHCFLQVEAEVEGDWPPTPTRCPHCRLLIGPGRARASAAAKPGARG